MVSFTQLNLVHDPTGICDILTKTFCYNVNREKLLKERIAFLSAPHSCTNRSSLCSDDVGAPTYLHSLLVTTFFGQATVVTPISLMSILEAENLYLQYDK